MVDVIAIDGPAGAGKSTVARMVASALGYTYLDTGAMYRSVAWLAIVRGIAIDNTNALLEIAREMRIEFGTSTATGRQVIKVNGTNVTDAIRLPEVSSMTSTISANAELRTVVVGMQRDIAARAGAGVVLEGRDIGTVVFPDARLKVFLTASEHERAKRRTMELKDRGAEVEFSDVLRDQVDRDSRDSARLTSPLVPAADAVLIDTGGMAVAEVVDAIIKLHGTSHARRSGS